MWFECSECGGRVNRPSAPAVCPECGVAGASFTSADPDDLTGAESDGDGLRGIWLRAGLEQPDLVAEA
jgi:hypothetical protein